PRRPPGRPRPGPRCRSRRSGRSASCAPGPSSRPRPAVARPAPRRTGPARCAPAVGCGKVVRGPPAGFRVLRVERVVRVVRSSSCRHRLSVPTFTQPAPRSGSWWMARRLWTTPSPARELQIALVVLFYVLLLDRQDADLLDEPVGPVLVPDPGVRHGPL